MSSATALSARITSLCSQLYAAEYRLLELIREFDEKEYWADLGLCSCAHWLNFQCGIGMNAAREKVRVAHALKRLPKISDGFCRGELSYSKVRAMTRVADSNNEDYLIMIARHGTAHHVERLISKYRSVARRRGAADSDTSLAGRELNYYYDEDGYLVVKARMPAEQGALVIKALEMAMEKSFRDASDTNPTDADVTAEKSASTAMMTSEDDTREPRAARRADGLADIAETYMNNNNSSGSTADRYQVIVHVTAETSHIEGGPGVTAETSRRISCDSSLVQCETGVNGEPMSIGRRSRTIPPAMRRALHLRDGGCRFPGCTNTRFVDGHHIKHWADGGETSLDNLVLLCRRHHHLVHEGGFSCRRSPDGEIWFENREQRLLDRHVRLPGIASGEELQKWLAANVLEGNVLEGNIDPDACVPQYISGDRIDWQMAVSTLCELA